jgi:hypothetical protein
VSDRKDDLRRQFGTVWRMASSGLDTLREVVVRSSQAGKLRVDLALMARERQQLLVQLGEKVATLVEEGAVELPEDAQKTLERVRDLEQRIKADRFRMLDNAFGAPRGYEPEAGSYAADPLDADDLDEHAEVAITRPKKKRPKKNGR